MARRRGGGIGGPGWLVAVAAALGWLFSEGEDPEPRRTAPRDVVPRTETRLALPDQRSAPEPRQLPPEIVKSPPRLFVYVTGEVVNVRAGPSMEHRVIGQGRRGDRGEELGRSGGWVWLRFERTALEGYMYGRYVARAPLDAAPVAGRSPPATSGQPALTTIPDDAIRQALVQESIARYQGSCPCPYNVDRGGRRCGGRSAYSRPGGASPYCYASDVPASAVAAYRQRSATW
jgi:hypothetical protein